MIQPEKKYISIAWSKHTLTSIDIVHNIPYFHWHSKNITLLPMTLSTTNLVSADIVSTKITYFH
jgi:hypothetical protein